MIKITYTAEPSELLTNGSSVLNEVSRALPFIGLYMHNQDGYIDVVLNDDCEITEAEALNAVSQALPFNNIAIEVI